MSFPDNRQFESSGDALSALQGIEPSDECCGWPGCYRVILTEDAIHDTVRKLRVHAELLAACEHILAFDRNKIGSVGEGLLKAAIQRSKGEA